MIDKPGGITPSWVTPRVVLHAQHQALNGQGRCPVCDTTDQFRHDLAFHERHVRSQPSCSHDFQVLPDDTVGEPTGTASSRHAQQAGRSRLERRGYSLFCLCNPRSQEWRCRLIQTKRASLFLVTSATSLTSGFPPLEGSPTV